MNSQQCDFLLHTECTFLNAWTIETKEFSFQVGEAALSILHTMASAHSDLDDAGEIVTPTPRVKRILSSPRCLPHVAQVLLSLHNLLFLRT